MKHMTPSSYSLQHGKEKEKRKKREERKKTCMKTGDRRSGEEKGKEEEECRSLIHSATASSTISHAVYALLSENQERHGSMVLFMTL